MEKKYFTLDEANQMLPFVRAQLAELKNIKRLIAEKLVQMEKAGLDLSKLSQKEKLTENESAELAQLQLLADQVQDRVFELTSLGILLKDIDQGLVDFYCQMPGEEVLLCWKEGEPEIQFFHSLEGGFANRQSLFEKSILQNITQVH